MFTFSQEAPTTSGTSPLPLLFYAGDPRVIRLSLPTDLNRSAPAEPSELTCLLLEFEPDWKPQDTAQAAFALKALVVNWKTKGSDVRVGVQGAADLIEALLGHDLAAYLDGYIQANAQDPWLPEADPTGKMWLREQAEPSRLLARLLDASASGVEAVWLDGSLPEARWQWLASIARLPVGTIEPPALQSSLQPEQTQFFLNPSNGESYLALDMAADEKAFLSWKTEARWKVEILYPAAAPFDWRQYGAGRLEMSYQAALPGALFHLVPEQAGQFSETVTSVDQRQIDPYELVVRNQVFKDAESRKWSSMISEEEVNYRYQGPNGTVVDITFMDTVYRRKGQPTERVRREFYIGGVRWPYEELPELPLIQPEKVQQEPLEIDLNRSYTYTYAGVDQLDGHATYRVDFRPLEAGNFASGSVWIDQKSGAHRRLRAVQANLQAPVTGSELTASFGWVRVDGQDLWLPLRESNLLTLNVVGERVAIQLDSSALSRRLDDPGLEQQLAAAYASNVVILRDGPKGFRYLSKKGQERVLNEEPVTRKKLLLGGILLDPALEFPTPLAGINFTDLDFRGRGMQANLFLAGAINSATLSEPSLFGSRLDLTGTLFLTALYFSDSIYQGSERREDLELKTLTESANLTLGIPLHRTTKLTLNTSLRYLAFKDGEDTDPAYQLPNDTLESIGRLGLAFDFRRFTSALQLEWVKRSDWQSYGLPAAPEANFDSYRRLQLDMALSKRLPKFQSLSVDARYLKGWDLDRFSQFGFGFFDNSVSGFGTSGIKGEEAVRLRLGYDVGIKGLFQLNSTLDGAKAWPTQGGDPVDLVGLGLAANFIGPWKLLMRLNLGYGLTSSLPEEEGDVSGQILFLRLF
jgi:hypothetical protein